MTNDKIIKKLEYIKEQLRENLVYRNYKNEVGLLKALYECTYMINELNNNA